MVDDGNTQNINISQHALKMKLAKASVFRVLKYDKIWKKKRKKSTLNSWIGESIRASVTAASVSTHHIWTIMFENITAQC